MMDPSIPHMAVLYDAMDWKVHGAATRPCHLYFAYEDDVRLSFSDSLDHQQAFLVVVTLLDFPASRWIERRGR